jgi:cytochrome o ubiquinol oxidase operon protein cyoD
MSNLDTTTQHHEEHGTTASYVSGFLLSLLFTFIPYYLVIEKKVSGNALLATILGFAVIQMIIQLLFFCI